jgi:protein TonB
MNRKTRKKRWVLRQSGALLVMCGGSSMVFAMVLSMNQDPPPAPKKKRGHFIQLRVERKRKPPAKRKVRRKVQRVERSATPRAPLPELGVGLSGVDLGIPSLGGAELDGLSDGLVGGNDTVKDMVMTERSVDVPPRPVFRKPPRYPARARADGLNGRVTLKLLISTDGSVVDVRVVDSSDRGFERAAVEAVEKWRFEPARYKGRPVKVWAQQIVRFKLG